MGDNMLNIRNLIQQINQIIKSGKYLANRDKILDFLKDSVSRYYFFSKLPKKIENLKGIEFLLEELAKGERPFELFNIFKESINVTNSDFIIKFIQRHYEELGGKLGDDLFREESLRTIKKIIKEYPDAANNAFDLIKQVLKLRKEEYKKVDTRRAYSEEKSLISKLLEQVFHIYKEREDSQKIRETIRLIDSHFNLIEDEGDFVIYTPNNIFKILKDYIDIDFGNHFRKVTKIIIGQYLQRWKNEKGENIYDGWELMGGGISFWEGDYKVSDRHFVKFTLQPALEEYYKKDKNNAWKFITDNCISTTEEVSKDKPDFLNRAAIPIIIDRYKEKDERVSQEAFEILKEFILSRRGIFHKPELTFQEIRRDFPEDKKWKLVKISIDKYKLPVNPFVEQITLDSSEKGNVKAKEIIKSWFKSPNYYQKGRIFERNIVGILSRFLDFSFQEGVEMFKSFISQEHFIKDFDTFDTFEVAGVLNKILNKNFEVGLEILNNLVKKKKLSDNEQILLCSSLPRGGASIQENEEILTKIYSGFLDPFLKSLNDDIMKIEGKITRHQSREAIVEFANVLAKHKKIPEAMRIVRIFVKDSDPSTPAKVDPRDPEGKYDEHKRIEQGEDTHAITTVRGQCAWVLMECAILQGREYIGEIIDLTEKLTQDRNYYIQLMSCYPLSQLARNRLAVMPDNRERLFFNKDTKKALEMAKRVEKIGLKLLRKFSALDQKPRDVLMKVLLQVFGHIRGLNEDNARILLETILQCDEEVISEAAPLFIYFAEFRQKSFKDWKWKMRGLYDDLESFNNKPFQELLINILKRGNNKINSSFVRHFCTLVEKSLPEKPSMNDVGKYNEAFEISNRYLNILVKNYDHQTFENIYSFIQENISDQFEECYKLWQECLEKERSVVRRMVKEAKVNEVYWWPFNYNHEILIIVKQKDGDERFLDSLEFLLDYPREVNIGDMGKIVEVLETLPSEYNQRVVEIFDKLIDRNPTFYDQKEKWKKEKKIKLNSL